jgi:hypothetical protein
MLMAMHVLLNKQDCNFLVVCKGGLARRMLDDDDDEDHYFGGGNSALIYGIRYYSRLRLLLDFLKKATGISTRIRKLRKELRQLLKVAEAALPPRTSRVDLQKVLEQSLLVKQRSSQAKG